MSCAGDTENLSKDMAPVGQEMNDVYFYSIAVFFAVATIFLQYILLNFVVTVIITSFDEAKVRRSPALYPPLTLPWAHRPDIPPWFAWIGLCTALCRGFIIRGNSTLYLPSHQSQAPVWRTARSYPRRFPPAEEDPRLHSQHVPSAVGAAVPPGPRAGHPVAPR